MLKRSDLHKYQVSTIEEIKNKPEKLIVLDMGLGKTVISLTAIHDLMYDELEIVAVLVIAPPTVAETVWDSEIDDWSHLKGNLRVEKVIGTPVQRIRAMRKPAEVYTASSDNLQWLFDNFDEFECTPTMLIIDELSLFKRSESNRFKELQNNRFRFDRVVGLTGTLTPNGYEDLWSQVYLIDEGARLGKTKTPYMRMHFQRENDHSKFSRMVLKSGHAKLIQENLRDLCISIKKEDVLKELPPTRYSFRELVMTKTAMNRYRELKQEMYLELGGEEITVQNAAVLAGKLLQAANGLVYGAPDEETLERPVVRFHNIKMKALKEIIEVNPGRQILIIYSYSSDRDAIMKELKHLKPRIIRGKKAQDDWNSGEIQIGMLHPRSGGHGINLQKGGADFILWYTMPYSLELYQQTNARIDRQGKKKKTYIGHLVMRGTVEDKIRDTLSDRHASQEELLACIRAEFL